MSDQTNGQPDQEAPAEAPKGDEYKGHTYDQELDVWPFRIKLRNGTYKHYELRQMGGLALDTWTAYQAGLVRVDKKGNRTPKENMDGFHANLICLCCYDKDTGELVPANVIRGWKGPIQSDLFDRCQKMNGLDDEAEDRAKKA
jgi:hypothetical protein